MNKEYYAEYYVRERQHWWFLARLEILRDRVARFRPTLRQDEPLRILNAGIATGATSLMLADFGEVTNLEYDADCCTFVRDRLSLEVVNGSLTALPFPDGAFDLICAFDVVEHIEADDLALQEMHRCLRPGGGLLLTVPAFMFLWSEHDVINHHYRRYHKGAFSALQQKAGFSVKRTTYFNSLLFPPIALARLAQRMLHGPALPPGSPVPEGAESDFSKFESGSVTNEILKQIFLLERSLLRTGLNFPAGVSILSQAIKG